ncbi:MAG: GNAT family N-acetyltransferase [Candidatus Thermoplasmatota archaeon]
MNSLPDARGRGLGSRLLDELENVAVGLNVVELHLEVDHANLRAHGLYKRLG